MLQLVLYLKMTVQKREAYAKLSGVCNAHIFSLSQFIVFNMGYSAVYVLNKLLILDPSCFYASSLYMDCLFSQITFPSDWCQGCCFLFFFFSNSHLHSFKTWALPQLFQVWFDIASVYIWPNIYSSAFPDFILAIYIVSWKLM